MREKVRGLKEAVGAAAAGALLKNCPHLLGHVRPADAPARLDALAGALALHSEALRLMLCSRSATPEALVCDADAVHTRVAVLCSTLQMAPGEKLAKLLFKHAAVLRINPDLVHARSAAVAHALGLDSARAAKLFQTNPGCLLAPPSTVAASMEALRLALGVPEEKVMQLCLQNSSLLWRAAGSLTNTISALQQHLDFQQEDLEQHAFMLHIPAAQVGPRLEALPAALRISRDDAGVLLKDSLGLLTIPSPSLEASWEQLLQCARLRPEWSRQLAAMTAPSLRRLCAVSSTRIKRRVGDVLALDPDPNHLPALSSFLIPGDTKFAKVLLEVQSKRYRARTRSQQYTERSVQARYPSLWRQL